MEIEKTPMWLRILELILGIAAIIIAVILIAMPALIALQWVILFFAIGLLFLGISSLMKGFFNKDLPGWSRALNIIAGIIAIALAFVPLTETIIGAWMVLWFMAFGMMFYGLTMLMLGFAADAPGWYRALLIIFGFILLIISFQVIWYPIWGLFFTLFVISFGLIIGGFQLIISGALGTPLRGPTAKPEGVE